MIVDSWGLAEILILIKFKCECEYECGCRYGYVYPCAEGPHPGAIDDGEHEHVGECD